MKKADMARLFGFSHDTLRSWEVGKCAKGRNNLYILLEALSPEYVEEIIQAKRKLERLAELTTVDESGEKGGGSGEGSGE